MVLVQRSNTVCPRHSVQMVPGVPNNLQVLFLAAHIHMILASGVVKLLSKPSQHL
jgi:hypothetical protein